ncbi:MAG: FliM/FliN family flagellar motor switch protein [Rhodospirillales bacterium]|nr:FliM/FliN family flagellar motor switch protein [Rhodospirillales bacterium]
MAEESQAEVPEVPEVPDVTDERENAIQDVVVELTVVLGKSVMPIEHLLRMGRGAIIELETMVEDDVWILVKNRVIARGQVMISGERLAVAITESVTPTDYTT